MDRRELEERGPLSWFVRNHVAANLLMVFVMAAGALTLLNVTIETFPEIESDSVTVLVPYRGASPAESEEGVCIRIEEAVAGVEGIKQIRSIADEGKGTVIIALEEDADKQRALEDIKAAVDRILTFPKETERPIISLSTRRRDVISVAIYGDVPERTLKQLAEDVRDELTAIEGISQVDVAGIRRPEISIEVSEEALRRYRLSFDQVAAAVRQASLDMPGGSVKTAGGEILLRTKGLKYHGPEFEKIVLRSKADGTRLLLGDVAHVVDGFEETEIETHFNGHRAALVRVYRVGNESALDVAAKTRALVEKRKAFMPAGVHMTAFQDDSRILKSRLSLLLRNGRMGLLLVFLCLALFLDLRLAFWTTLGIPISFLGGIWLMPILGVTINMVSLFAFIVVLGIVVDDAIVVGENVFEWRSRGLSPIDASIRGVKEMAVPVIFAVLTTVAAFLPLALTEGRMGKIMYAIPAVVIAVLFFSLLEALFILPAHLAGKKRGGIPGPIARAQAGIGRALDRFIQGPYAKTLDLSLRWRYVTMAVAFATLFIMGGYAAGGYIKFTFMPQVDSDNMTVSLTMPQGTPVAQTRAIIHRIEDAAKAVREEYDRDRGPDDPSIFNYISSTLGAQPFGSRRGGPMGGSAASGSNLGEVIVELLGSEERSVPSREVLAKWREKVGEVPGAVALTFKSNLFSAGDAVNVELAHRKMDTLLSAVDRVKEAVRAFPGVVDVADTFLPGKREIKLDLTPAGRSLGITLRELARQVRQAFYGEEVQRIQRGRDDVRVMVRYPKSERESLEDIRHLRIRTPGGEVPFSTVARVRPGRGYAAIRRTDRRRVVSVVADVDEAVGNADEINRTLKTSVLPAIQEDYPGLAFDFEGAQRAQNESMGSLRKNFLIALLAIYTLLAIPFKSYSQPLVVMSAIPFGIVGALTGHIILGLNLSLLSMFGVVALSGVVVNDSLVMIDQINRERREGASLDAAIRDSGARRFRPIMLTTITTFFGLIPIILETSVQAKFLIPMAVSLGFGVAFATAITLIIIPVQYAILEDIKAVVRWAGRWIRSGATRTAAEGKSEGVEPG